MIFFKIYTNIKIHAVPHTWKSTLITCTSNCNKSLTYISGIKTDTDYPRSALGHGDLDLMIREAPKYNGNWKFHKQKHIL